MKKSSNILFIKEVAERCGVSVPTVTRWLCQARNGHGRFPLPISEKNCKGRWLSSDIDNFLQSQSTPNIIPQNFSPVKQMKRERHDFDTHQAEIKRRLLAHAAGRKPKPQNKPDTEREKPCPDGVHSNLIKTGVKGLLIMSILLIQLFSSKPHVTGALHNTSFSNEPTEITETNAEAFFRNDHTTNCFKDGHCKGENFVYATAIPLDIDNSHSDNPDDWIHPDDIASKLKELGINHVIVPSRNHLLSKDGKDPRPKFHVYLPLSEPLYDSGIFVLLCEWCIRTFNADPKVKSKAQKMFGYGDNPNAFVKSWNRLVA